MSEPQGDPHRTAAADPRRRRRRRRRLAWAGLAVVLAGGLAAAGVVFREPLRRGAATAAGGIADAGASVWDAWAGWSTSLRHRAAGVPDPPPPTTQPPPVVVASHSVLFVVGDSADTAAFALVVRPPSGPVEMVMVPQTLLLQVPGYGEFSMAEALGFGGPGLARLAVANELGIRIDDLVPLPPGGMDVLGEGPVVGVPVELFVVGPDGSRRLIAAGPQRLAPDLVELVLGEPGTGDQYDWLLRQEAVWEGVLAMVGEDPDLAARLAAGAGDPGEAAALLGALAADPLIGTPPVDRVAMGGSRDALVLSTDRIDAYTAGRLGHLVIREGRRPRVEILNGNGVAGSAIQVAEALVAEGFYVFRTGNADRFDHPTSLVIAQGEAAADAAREAAGVLGIAGVVMEGTAPSLVVDVSIIVGADLAPKEG